MKVLIPVLAFYALVVYPAIHLIFSGNRILYHYGHIFYFTLALAFALKYVSLEQLGFNKNNLRKTLTIGILLGLLPVTGVFLMDSLLIKTGLSQSELFTGADLRKPEEMGFYLSPAGNIFSIFFVPLIEQVFIMGWVVNNLLIKENIGRVIVSGGLIYSLLHFDLGIGSLFLGMITAGLLKYTGSIIPPILMHIGFAIAEIAIVFSYPRLISILVFFV